MSCSQSVRSVCVLDVLLGITNQSNKPVTWLGDIRNPENTSSIISPHHTGGSLSTALEWLVEEDGTCSREAKLPYKNPKAEKAGATSKTFTGLLFPMGEEKNFEGKHPRYFMIQLLLICVNKWLWPQRTLFSSYFKWEQVCGMFIEQSCYQLWMTLRSLYWLEFFF